MPNSITVLYFLKRNGQWFIDHASGRERPLLPLEVGKLRAIYEYHGKDFDLLPNGDYSLRLAA
jgi:hypothetical protein